MTKKEWKGRGEIGISPRIKYYSLICHSISNFYKYVSMCEILSIQANSMRLEIVICVIIIKLRLDLGIRGLKTALRTNLESGPRFAKVWFTQSCLPWFLMNPRSASSLWHISQQKHWGCHVAIIALITRPIMNSPKQKIPQN